ncbi:MAG: hypothetical protein M3320_00385, partial [Actinomycetota bacterium]|nr:hypothetical protein [Actinomycetota bacterium]
RGLRTFPTEVITWVRGRDGDPVLLTGFVVGAGRDDVVHKPGNRGIRALEPRTVTVEAHPVDFQSGGVALTVCPVSGLSPVDSLVNTNAPVRPALLERAWRRLRAVAEC